MPSNETIRSGTPRGPARVLVVDDGPDDQHLLALFLRAQGAIVDVADHGLHALDRIGDARNEGRPYTLIVSDMDMPEMDGYTLARTLRNRGLHVPILAVTANAGDGESERCIEAGCTAYLAKPIEKSALLNACATLMRSAAAA